MTDDPELAAWLAERDALLLNPSLEAATAYWIKHEFPPPTSPLVPLAMVHKARTQWLESTDAMLAESIKWLTDNGYEASFKKAPPLTPEQRDADRIFIGKRPLNES